MKKFLSLPFLLSGIVLLAFLLRFVHLGSNPPSLTWDEVAWGYNAYSLGIDGRDEFGRFLPHDYLESFGDFKPPIYAYLDILPVKLLGLTEYATRIPSALLGTLTVLVTFFLVRELFYETKYRERLALIAAGILAVSPWHIMLSRAAFEANVATFFLVSGVTLFLFAVRRNLWLLLLSAAAFVASMYTFNTSRIVAPLLVILLALGFWRTLWKQWKITLVAGAVGVLLLLPTALFLISPQASLRFKEVNIFSDIGVIQRTNQEIANDHNSWWSKIIHNRRLAYSVLYLKHYFDNLSPNFLFITGDGNAKFSTQDTGQMYVWELPFFVAGILFLLRRREGKWWVVPLWLIIGIIPAATARETPHALRTEATLPTFQIFVAYGVVVVFEYLRKHLKEVSYRVVLGIVILAAGLNVGYFVHGYFAHYAWLYSGEWQYGYKDSIAYVQSVEKNYDKIMVTESLGRPYIYYLFYMHITPDEFRQQAKIERDPFGFVTVRQVGKYQFGKFANTSASAGEKILYINDEYNIPKNAHILKTFTLESGEVVLTAYTL